MPVIQTGRVNDVIKTRILFDDKGIAVRGNDGCPVIADEILYANEKQKTAGLNCHVEDKQIEVISNEYSQGW